LMALWVHTITQSHIMNNNLRHVVAP